MLIKSMKLYGSKYMDESSMQGFWNQACYVERKTFSENKYYLTKIV